MTSAPVTQTDILGVQIDALTMELAISTIEGWIERGEEHYVCICNVHSVMSAQRDPAYMSVLKNAGLRTPDGMPLVWLSRRAGQKYVERVCGPDLLPALAARSQDTGHRHYFYGGAPGVAQDLADNLATRFPNIQVAGSQTPDWQPVGVIESHEVIDRINATRPDIIWVGLGSPKQEIWAANHLETTNASVIIAVGAAFDFHTGRIRRAPGWMQRNGLEWAYRFAQEPRRLWKRYVLLNTSFVAYLARDYLVSRLTNRRSNNVQP